MSLGVFGEGLTVEQMLNADIDRLQAEKAVLCRELEFAADTFRDFSYVLGAIGKDVMSAAADVAERHIREQVAAIGGAS